MSEQVVHTQNFNVEGMRCARCIHAIESALRDEDDVHEARVNMSTNRLSLTWEGDMERAKHFMQRVESLGYKIKPYVEPKTDNSEIRYLLRCMAVSGFAMGNIMLLSVALWSSDQAVMGMATRDLLHWLSALIALPAIIYAGRPFFSSAYSVLRHGRTNMDVPISLALILASGMSLFETIQRGEHAYFDSAVMLLFFLLVGRWLDARARGKARENAERLLAMMHGMATVRDGGRTREVPISELSQGMEVLIAAGEKVPTDVTVLQGFSELDTSLVTGETAPRSVKVGQIIYGGTLNLSGSLVCRVEKASEDSLLADIIRLLEQAEQGRASYVRLADKAAALYTPVVHTLAIGAFVGWYLIGGAAWQQALLVAITTLIITCPCALGLAVPVVQVLATSWLMKRGILMKSGDALERLSEVDCAVFDKTGTLTKGIPVLTGEYDQNDLQIAASLAVHSKHPYSRAISATYTGDLIGFDAVEEVAGLGVQGIRNGINYRLGKNLEAKGTAGEHVGPQIWLSIEGKEAIPFYLKDTLRDDSADVISQLHINRITPYMLSGDRYITVEQVAQEVGVEKYYSDLLPADKTKIIKQLQSEGHHVLMVGDGLNDAPSLAQANVSLSPATGVDITQNTADIVFQGKGLIAVLQSWQMAKLSTSLVKQNFVLAVLYNCIAIPIALAGLVTPLIAAIAMSSSSLIVIANSFRIYKQRED